MSQTKIIVEVRGGVVYAIYGDRLPEGVEIDFVIRDMDSIEAGEADDVEVDDKYVVHYW